MTDQDSRFDNIRYVFDGDYGVAIQTVETQGGYKRIKISHVWRSPQGPRFSAKPFNDTQKERGKYNPNISIPVRMVDNLCAALLMEAGKGAATDTTPDDDGGEDKPPF